LPATASRWCVCRPTNRLDGDDPPVGECLLFGDGNTITAVVYCRAGHDAAVTNWVYDEDECPAETAWTYDRPDSTILCLADR
jgi:hypothetical protein